MVAFRAFDSILRSVKVLKTDVQGVSKTELLGGTAKLLDEVILSIKNLRPFLKGTKGILKQTKIGNFNEIGQEFSESEKILAADYIINYLYDELFDRLSDVAEAVKHLSKEFDHENNPVLGKIFEKNDANLEKNIEATRNVWGQHSTAAQNAVLFAKANAPVAQTA